MDTTRFSAIVDAYGAESRRWPEAERAEAEAFAQTAQGQRLLDGARALDLALDAGAEIAPVSLAFHRRAAEQAPRSRTSAWRAVAALAACAVLGVAIGAGGAGLLAERQAADAALLLLLDDGEFG